MRNLLSFLLGFTLTLAVLGTLAALSGCAAVQKITGTSCNSQQPGSVTAWTNFGQCSQTIQLGTSFQVGSTVIGYVVEPQYAPLVQGQTMSLTYTVSGTPNYIQNDKTDINPASITLFIWERGDNMQDPQRRWWCPLRGSLDPGSHTLSCVIGTQWTNVYGAAGQVAGQINPGWPQALANPFAVGFTFGGARFYGHGVTSNPPVTFTINSFTVQ